MNDIVNLNRFRKTKKAAKREKQAEENRLKFGRTKAEKACDSKDRVAKKGHIDSHRLIAPDSTD